MGDGPLPEFKALSPFIGQHQLLAQLAQKNSTAEMDAELLNNAPLTEQYWTALSASRRLLLTISPSIADWLDALYREGHISLKEPADIHPTYQVSEDTELLAAYRYSENTLYLGRAFWRLSDGEKAAVLAHEYRHAHQNIGKRLSHQLAELVGLGSLQQASPMEAEALAYEQSARIALGLI